MLNISTKKIAQAVYEASLEMEGKNLDSILSSTTDFLMERNIMGKAPEVLSHLQKIIDKKEGVIRAHIETPHPLSKETSDILEDELKKRYNVNKIHLEVVENKKHLGGIKIQVADEVINLTLSTRLHQLQNYLITQI